MVNRHGGTIMETTPEAPAQMRPYAFAALVCTELRMVKGRCGSGKRSLTAAEHRLAAGQRHAAHMGGGMAAWKAAGLPVVTPGSLR